MGLLTPQKQPVRVILGASSVEDAVAFVRRRQELDRSVHVRLRMQAGGRVHASQPGSRYNNPPVLVGRFDEENGQVRLDGVIREPLSEVIIPGIPTVLGVLLLVAAVVALAVSGAVPFVFFLSFGVPITLFGIVLRALRHATFPRGSEPLMSDVMRLLPLLPQHGRGRLP